MQKTVCYMDGSDRGSFLAEVELVNSILVQDIILLQVDFHQVLFAVVLHEEYLHPRNVIRIEI